MAGKVQRYADWRTRELLPFGRCPLHHLIRGREGGREGEREMRKAFVGLVWFGLACLEPPSLSPRTVWSRSFFSPPSLLHLVSSPLPSLSFSDFALSVEPPRQFLPSAILCLYILYPNVHYVPCGAALSTTTTTKKKKKRERERERS